VPWRGRSRLQGHDVRERLLGVDPAHDCLDRRHEALRIAIGLDHSSGREVGRLDVGQKDSAALRLQPLLGQVGDDADDLHGPVCRQNHRLANGGSIWPELPGHGVAHDGDRRRTRTVLGREETTLCQPCAERLEVADADRL
jgi:hypothetical protein